MTSLLSRPASSSTRILPSFTSPHRTFAPLALSRAFSTSTPPPQPPSTSSKDPSHPYLWYHQLTNPPRIALSFLASTPRNGSTTVLGYLGGGPDSGLNDFRQEPRFMELLHQTIRGGLEQGKAITVEDEATSRPVDGYIHITDERAIPPAGRIAETEDIIGSVFVQDGKIVPSTYEALPSYRLVSSNGPLILPRGLDQHLLDTLSQIHVQEQEQEQLSTEQ